MKTIQLNFTDANMVRILKAMNGPITPASGETEITEAQVTDYVEALLKDFVSRYEEAVEVAKISPAAFAKSS
jgi:hypothetical protein